MSCTRPSDRPWLHDHDPLLHRRPADAGHDAQGPLPRPRRGAEHDPDLHRRRQGRGAGDARARRQAGRLGHPGADAERVGGGPEGGGVEIRHRRGGQRRDEGRRRGRAEGHPRLQDAPLVSPTSTTTPIRRSSPRRRPRCWKARWSGC